MDLTAWHKKRTDPSEWLVASGGGFWSEKSTSKKPWKKKTSFQRVLCNGAEMHRETWKRILDMGFYCFIFWWIFLVLGRIAMMTSNMQNLRGTRSRLFAEGRLTEWETPDSPGWRADIDMQWLGKNASPGRFCNVEAWDIGWLEDLWVYEPRTRHTISFSCRGVQKQLISTPYGLSPPQWHQMPRGLNGCQCPTGAKDHSKGWLEGSPHPRLGYTWAHLAQGLLPMLQNHLSYRMKMKVQRSGCGIKIWFTKLRAWFEASCCCATWWARWGPVDTKDGPGDWKVASCTCPVTWQQWLGGLHWKGVEIRLASPTGATLTLMKQKPMHKIYQNITQVRLQTCVTIVCVCKVGKDARDDWGIFASCSGRRPQRPVRFASDQCWRTMWRARAAHAGPAGCTEKTGVQHVRLVEQHLKKQNLLGDLFMPLIWVGEKILRQRKQDEMLVRQSHPSNITSHFRWPQSLAALSLKASSRRYVLIDWS